MTNLDDFDRSLGDFLADGPNTAPEAPVVAALAHARTTPRRPDPLARLRRDVMRVPSRPIVGLRPVLVLALGALVFASIGVALVGSPPSDPVRPLGPSSSPPPASPRSSAAPRTTFSAQVPVLVEGGQPFDVLVTDTTGSLVDATSLPPEGGVSVEFDRPRIAADPGDPRALIVTWAGRPCDDRSSMVVDEAGHAIAIERPSCRGDAIALDRIVRLRFDAPVVASDWTAVAADAVPGTEPPLGG